MSGRDFGIFSKITSSHNSGTMRDILFCPVWYQGDYTTFCSVQNDLSILGLLSGETARSLVVLSTSLPSTLLVPIGLFLTGGNGLGQ